MGEPGDLLWFRAAPTGARPIGVQFTGEPILVLWTAPYHLRSGVAVKECWVWSHLEGRVIRLSSNFLFKWYQSR